MNKSVIRPPGWGPTTIILCGLMLTGVVLPDDSAASIFSSAAVGVGISL